MTHEALIQQIQQLEDRRYAATVAKDGLALAELLDPELMYVHSSGVADTKSSYLDGLRSGVWDYHEIRRLQSRWVISGDTVLHFGRLAIRITIKGDYKAFESNLLAVWKLGAQGWRLLGVQSALAS